MKEFFIWHVQKWDSLFNAIHMRNVTKQYMKTGHCLSIVNFLLIFLYQPQTNKWYSIVSIKVSMRYDHLTLTQTPQIRIIIQYVCLISAIYETAWLLGSSTQNTKLSK